MSRRLVAIYDYPDERGRLLLRKWRFEPKGFRMEARTGEGKTWVHSVVHFERKYPRARAYFHSLLFNLPLLLTDPPRIALTEGEKDAVTLTAVGVPALSHWQGAQNFTPEQAERFRGYAGRVEIVADADAAGAACAVRRYDLLRSVGIPEARLRLVVPATGHKDAADHLAAGHGLAEFRRWDLDAMRQIASRAPSQGLAGQDYEPGLPLPEWSRSHAVRASR